MLQATKRTGEQGARLQLQLRNSSSLSRGLLASNGVNHERVLNAFIAPGLRTALPVTRSRWSAGSYGGKLGRSTAIQLHQLRFQSTEIHSRRDTSSQVPPGLSKEKANTGASQASLGSTTAKKQGTTTASTNNINKDSSTSTSAVTEKPKATDSSSASSSTSVSKTKQPLGTRIWAKVKSEASHYWSGTKLLGKEIKISSRLQWKLLKGKSLTRRERRQVCTVCQHTPFS